ncbi:MAG: hypothetical protein WDM86_12065 [Rhizomicrobium sp.]
MAENTDGDDRPSRIDKLFSDGEMDKSNRSRRRARMLLEDFKSELAVADPNDATLDRVMEDFLAECVLGAAWYQAKYKNARRWVYFYIGVNILAIVFLPISLILLSKGWLWLELKGTTGQVTSQIAGLLTGILGVQKTLSTWYASQQRYAMWFKSASDLKSIYYGVTRKWAACVERNRAGFVAELRDATIAARKIIDAEELDYYQKLVLPSFDILDLLTAGRVATSSLVTSLLPSTPATPIAVIGRTAIPAAGSPLAETTDGEDPNGLVIAPGGPRPRSDVQLYVPQAAKTWAGIGDPEASHIGQSNWIAYASWTNDGKPIQKFVSSWIVPQPPALADSQVIYLFSGMQTADRNTILQPVLQWGSHGDGLPGDIATGPFWTVASWRVGLDGAWHSKHVRVYPGDRVTGVITLDQMAGGGFHYTCEFEGLTDTFLPTVAPIAELNQCVQTLEAYVKETLRTPYDLDPGLYPATPDVVFEDISVEVDGKTVRPPWAPKTVPPTSAVADRCKLLGTGAQTAVQIVFR